MSACSSIGVDDRLGTAWQGCSVNALERRWGPPDEALPEGDGRRLRYASPDGRCTYYFTTDWSGTIVGFRRSAASPGACGPNERFRPPLRPTTGEGCG